MRRNVFFHSAGKELSCQIKKPVLLFLLKSGRRAYPAVPLPFAYSSQNMPLRVLPLQYPAAVTGGTCRSLAIHASASSACAGSVRRSGAIFHPLRPVPSQPSAQVRVPLMRTYVLPEWGLLCKASPDVLSPSLLSAIFGNGRAAVSDTPTVAQICRAVNYAGALFSLSISRRLIFSFCRRSQRSARLPKLPE